MFIPHLHSISAPKYFFIVVNNLNFLYGMTGVKIFWIFTLDEHKKKAALQ